MSNSFDLVVKFINKIKFLALNFKFFSASKVIKIIYIKSMLNNLFLKVIYVTSILNSGCDLDIRIMAAKSLFTNVLLNNIIFVPLRTF